MKTMYYLIAIALINVMAYGQTTSSSLSFDGMNDLVEAPAITSFNAIGEGDFTMEARIKVSPENTSLYPIILSNRTGHTTGIVVFIHTGSSPSASGKVWINIAGINYPASNCPDLRDNLCHHIAVVRAENQLYFYLDGNLNTSRPILSNGNTIESHGNFRIGHDAAYSIGSMHFKGEIAEVRLWNVARCAEEILKHHQSSIIEKPASLLSYWKMNENFGGKINNRVNTGLNGILGVSAENDANDPSRLPSCTSLPENEISGPLCISKNTALTFTLDSRFQQQAIQYVWWFQGCASELIPTPGKPYEITLHTGQYETDGKICVGVSYQTAPGYKTFCKDLTSCLITHESDWTDATKQNTTTEIYFPNPFAEKVVIKISESMVSAKIIDIHGNLMIQTPLKGSVVELQTSHLTPGVYSLIIQYMDGHQENTSMIKR
ncbi:MAG: T9SS type A sorting domain-containing protein [Cytophagaceae bacterium]|jgi:hypothetical protein|nr:T9SS type A sorting domain-containing protein [Cytophagaceae bacterium]